MATQSVTPAAHSRHPPLGLRYRVSGRFSTLGYCVVLCVLVVSTTAAQKPYSVDEAWRAHFLSRASYCNEGDVIEWRCGAACRGVPTFQLSDVMSSIITGTFGFVGVDHTTKQIAVVFRGTTTFQNFLANALVMKTSYDESSSCGSQCEVHTGFYVSYFSLREQTRYAVLKLIYANPTYEILVTGHSLGGAIALLAAADLQERLNSLESAPYKPVSMYTFGSPRVGNLAFVKWVDSLLSKGAKYRITHAGDFVVVIPAIEWGYVHSASEAFYKTRSKRGVLLCNDFAGREDPECSLGVRPRSLRDHLWYMGDTTRCNKRDPVINTAVRDVPTVACIISLIGFLCIFL
ncbi:lipase, putative [Leishmania tarentolae]|uniref:Lipase, putative n=1 Tax=Leishmania tarentolae TaxID=5689 RepID=A0A640KMX6_LEITA|nr:lipase, putative [Leishmania tarentolae]